MPQKLLVICGPTATGKTELAIELTKKFDGVIISADSRQVYKYMDIGTGKGRIKVLGYDIVNPDEEFSVSSYVNFAKKEINKIIKQRKLPILVGGTGLYIKGIVDGIETIDIPPNKDLRKKLSKKTTNELFEMLSKINPQKAKAMNDSDKKNSRRLIRAMEISNFQSQNHKLYIPPNPYKTLFIGLTAPLEVLKKNINNRVDERVKAGFEKEIEFLKNKGYWKTAPQVTLGYKDWPNIEKWKREEFEYAKRQITWFKKDKRINWFDISSSNYKKEIEDMINLW